MTQIKDVRIGFPKPTHAMPHQGGLFNHYPKADALMKAYAALVHASSDEDRIRARTEIGGLLKHMAGVYHPTLPDLLAICRDNAEEMSDANLDKAVTLCEVAFHGSHAAGEKPDYQALLQIADHAFVFLMLLLRHKLARHEDAFADLHSPFFYFSHAAMTCRQQLGENISKPQMDRVTGSIATFLLLGRIDFFSMSATRQKALMRTLTPILTTCEIYFIPAGEVLDELDGFWVAREDDRLKTGRSRLQKSLAGASSMDRVVTAIAPLIHALEESGKKPDSTVQMQAVMSPAVNKLIRKKLGVLKHSDERLSVHESVHLLTGWDEVVDLPETGGCSATLLDIDSSGFRVIVNDPEAELPDVDSLIAISRPGHGVRRATLIWKRVDAKGVLMGGRWFDGEFDQIRFSMLGHSEMSSGIREWHALTRQTDEKHVACWLGERELQAGISVLLPVGDKKYASTLDQIDHRGGNYCQGVLLIGDEWKEVNFELDL